MPLMRSPNLKSKNAFTLIELLVVIAIIAILAAILFPVFAKARQQAHIAGCTSNMKQFGLAIQMYRDDNKGAMPQGANIWYPTSYGGGWFDAQGNPTQYNYFEALFSYMKTPGVAICPGKPIEFVRDSLSQLWYTDPTNKRGKTKWYGAVYTPSWHKHRAGSVTGNFFGHLPWSQGSNTVNLDNYDYRTELNCGQTETILLFCMSGTWTFWDDGRLPDNIARGSHERGTPALFADLHVKFATYDRVGRL